MILVIVWKGKGVPFGIPARMIDKFVTDGMFVTLFHFELSHLELRMVQVSSKYLTLKCL